MWEFDNQKKSTIGNHEKNSTHFNSRKTTYHERFAKRAGSSSTDFKSCYSKARAHGGIRPSYQLLQWMTRNRIPAENTLAVTLYHSASLGPRHQLRKFTISLVRINLGLRLHKTFLVLPPPSEPFRKPQNYLAQQNNNNDGIDARLMIHIASENAFDDRSTTNLKRYASNKKAFCR